MTNLEKMNQLTGANNDKTRTVVWAYWNGIDLIDLPLKEGFEEMKTSVDKFLETSDWAINSLEEAENWKKFLDADAEFVGVDAQIIKKEAEKCLTCH